MKTMKLSAFLLIILATVLSCQKDPEEVILNKVPIADAGTSDTITLPIKTITLAGSGTDADGNIVAYLWSQVAGPRATSIENPGSPSTIVNGFVEGKYLFQLMVTDNAGATGVDTVSISVAPAKMQTLVLQPANNPTERSVTDLDGTDQSSSTGIDLPIDAWTVNGRPVKIRSLLKFDLSSIPQSATIINAQLELYSYPSPTINGNLIDANYGASNSLLLQQVATDWNPATTFWANQPAGLTQNQIAIPHTNSSILDLKLDVRNIVSSMVKSNANYGFLLRLQNEVIYNSRIFVSSNNTQYAAKRPKLTVVYQ